MPAVEISFVVERRQAKIFKDNPLLDRLIEVGTKALRRGLVSGETLRAPRQQLRQPRASAFDLIFKQLNFTPIARLFGARRIFGLSSDLLREPATGLLLSKTITRSENSHVIQKNLTLAGGSLNGREK